MVSGSKSHLLIYAILCCLIFGSLFWDTFAQAEYETQQILIIPWGEQSGCLSTAFNTSDYYVFPPSPWAIYNDSVIVIADRANDGSRLISLASDGSQLGQLQFYGSSVPFPRDMAFSTSGLLALGYEEELFILNSELTLLESSIISIPDAYVDHICRSDHGTWWVIFHTYRYSEDEIFLLKYLVELNEDGSLDEPLLIYDGETGQGTSGAVFVTPDGELKNRITDKYGYSYHITNDDPGENLNKYDTQEIEVFEHHLQSDPGWTEFDYTVTGSHFLVSWLGNFYTLRGTDAGAVLMKYDLNDPPVCSLFIVTPMPYRGPSPAEIEFDATGSYDPDPCDELTFEWDFDGDHIYGEPVDDAYTGPPDNPTHSYTEDYTGIVNLKLTDNHGAESYCLVTVEVDII